jgi:hypothetical protein
LNFHLTAVLLFSLLLWLSCMCNGVRQAIFIILYLLRWSAGHFQKVQDLV